MKDFMVVILGSDENTYGFARALHEKYGVIPIALATGGIEVTNNSKIIDFRFDKKLHDEEHLVSVLVDLGKKLKKEYKKLVVIPCSDSYMEMLVNNRDKLVDFENKFISIKELKEFNDKKSFYEMCEKHDLPYPRSVMCTPKDYKEKIKKLEFNYPLILKPNNSNSLDYLDCEFEGKEKVYFINSKEELEEKFKVIYSSSFKGVLIIQEFVSGDDTNMRVLNVYCDRNGKVKVMSLGQPILEEYHPKTFGNYAAIVSIKGSVPIMKDIKRFLEDIHYTGAANFDIKIDAKTGKYYIFEINPRPGRSSFFTTPAGASLQNAYIEDLVYDRLEEQIGNTKEILWMNVPKVLVNKYVKNEEIKKRIKGLETCHTLIYKADKSPKRLLTVGINYARKIHYYPKYYIEKK